MKSKYFRIIMAGSMITLCQVASFLPVNGKGLFADVNITGITKVVGQIGGVSEVQAKDDWDDAPISVDDYDEMEGLINEGEKVIRPEGYIKPSDKAEAIAKAAKISSPVAYKINAKIFVNGNQIQLSDPVLSDGDRTYLPMRALGDALGKKVDWTSYKIAIFIDGDSTLEVPLNHNQAVKDKSITLQIDELNPNTVGFSKDGRTYLPQRFIAEQFGYKVSYLPNNGNPEIHLTSM